MNQSEPLGFVARAVLETVVRKRSVRLVTGLKPDRVTRAYEDQVTAGYLQAHRSSIGELDEKASYTITDAGLAALERDRDGI